MKNIKWTLGLIYFTSLKTGKTVDSIYDQNLFNIVTEYAGYNPSEISSAYHLSPDLISYIQDHSYLEISWCFKLSSNMSFQKTFLRINEMESLNKFTIYSATGSKDWPSGKELRHVVCNTISKQPISSKFYEQFLVPARCKFLGVNITEFNSIKKFLDIEQLATRYEFAQALRIELVQKRLQPKLLEAISKKLKNISFDSILAHNQLSNTNINNSITHHTVKIMQQSSVLKLIADAYRLPQKGLASIMKFYSQKSHKVSMMNSVAFKSLAHFLNLPSRSNASFGEMFVKLSSVMADLQHRMDAPMILIVDKNRVTKSVSNKTILNALISSAKEPRDVLVAFYEISPELEHFLEGTTFFQLQQMLGQTTIRLEHLSINFIVNLLKKQTKGNLRNGTLKFSQNNVNTMFYNAVKDIISHTKMIDFQRMYKKEWNAKKIYQQTLMSISKQQGLSGREFVRLYNMEGKKLSDVTRFSNYSLSKIKPRIQGNILEYTLEQLAQQVREQLKLPELQKSPSSLSNAQTKSFKLIVKKVKPGTSRSSSTERDVDASTLAKRTGI